MMFFDLHPWTGTQYCLRERNDDGAQCVNDHTGCLYNNGQNECRHPKPSIGTHDSPLLQKEVIDE